MVKGQSDLFPKESKVYVLNLETLFCVVNSHDVDCERNHLHFIQCQFGKLDEVSHSF